eukprot:XP_011676663.1 PREDICTED: helicase SKI2W [Strongylocentrotus purpuratus]
MRKQPRKSDPTNLYNVSLCPLQTTLQVERHATTGELLGYKEVFLGDTSATAKNSLSLSRQPGPLSESVRGSTTNFPFMPGGLAEEPFLDEDDDALVSDRPNEANDIDVDDLLTVPPGWEAGMVFEDRMRRDEVKEDEVEDRGMSRLIEASGEVGLDDIMGMDDRFDFLEKETEEDRAKEIEKESQKVSQEKAAAKDEELDKVLPEAQKKEKEAKKEEPLKEKSWAVNIDVSTPVDDFHKKVPVMAHQYPFELDIFQKQAVLQLENHQSVFVAAHTSAGKTVVAEYAIALSMRHLTRTVYTSPIKALSNQKFRDFKNTFGDVGLLTGDVQIKPEASCLIMTTEILRSMLYNGSDVIRDLEWVIFDEVHYINDSERGVVWEEVLIMLPEHVNIILLSATVPNTMEFADWVGQQQQRRAMNSFSCVDAQKTYADGVSRIDEDDAVMRDGRWFPSKGNCSFYLSVYRYKEAVKAKKARATKSSAAFGAKGNREGHFKSDKNVYMSVVEMLRKKEQLPIVCFTFSKKRCNDNSSQLSNLDLTTSSEKSEITVFIKKCVDRLKGSDKKLPQVVHLSGLLKHGIGVHHSGILPILKEVVEMLFQRGLVKLLFATETFAMGVNMPARTVLFDSIKKFDGTNKRHLHPGEYIQMAGRAGRRGLDTTGMVIILCKGDVPETSDLHYMMKGRPTKLESQFRLTYSMILNLLRVEELRVEDMMKRSFSEFTTRKDADKHRQLIKDLQQQVKQIRDIDCYMCSDLEPYYSTCKTLNELRRETQKIVLSHPAGVKSLVPGRVIIIRNKRYRKNTLGAVLSTSGASKDRKVKTLILCNPQSNKDSSSNSGETGDEADLHVPPIIKESFWRPEGEPSHIVEDFIADDVVGITIVTMKLDANKIVENFNKRQIPRFRNDPPGQSAVSATQELLRLTEANPDSLDTLDPVKDLSIREMDLVEKFINRAYVEKTVDQFNCILCFNFQQHYANMCHKMKLLEDMRHYRYLLSDRSLLLLPEYHQRIQVLKELNHIDKTNTIQLKGRVACEISNHELLITELVFQNILSLYPPNEIAALLSCMVFQERRCSEPELTKELNYGVKRIQEEALRIGTLQHRCGVQMPAEDYVEQYRFGLTQVVYEWANGMEFSEIIGLTDVTEGIIVRTIQRLDEVCRDVRNAARIVGDPILFSKMEEASQLIKRDIVFTASLYTQ